MKKTELSENFIRTVVEASGGFISPSELNLIISEFERELSHHYFNETSENNLLRLISSVMDKSSFLKDCVKYPHHTEIISAIVSNSNYLTDIVVRNPEYLYQLFNQYYLGQRYTEEYFLKELRENISKYKTLTSKLRFIRQYKNRNTLKIGLNDILGNSSLEDTVQQISLLAKSIISVLFNLCYAETLEKYQLPIPEPQYAIVALGKLGGDEVNYSSDVDLMIFYESNFNIGNMDYYSILHEATQLFTQYATDNTETGFIYRVDFRLRPDGNSAPLCGTINDYIKYYEARGEEWERQMLIKMSYVCGNRELYSRFENFAISYIYKSSLEQSPFARIRKMKTLIEHHSGGKENIKTLSGGIRDIEFSVQALQLLNGKKHPELRTPNTMTCIRVLVDKNILTPEEGSTYLKSYIEYRNIEHFLQLMNNIQTHEIPDDSDIQRKLAKFLGYSGKTELRKKLRLNRKAVRKIYDNILKDDSPESQSKNKNTLFEEIDFLSKNRAEKNIDFLRTGKGIISQKSFDSRTIKLFKEIEPFLLKELQKSANPDISLENFTNLIRHANFPSIWFGELKSNIFLKDLLTICLKSQRAINMLNTDGSLIDLVLTKKVFVKDIEENFDNLSLSQMKFILAVQFSLGLIKTEKFAQLLSSFVLHKLQTPNILKAINYSYFIAALGSAGSKEMNFASDIDLIVVVDKIDLTNSYNEDFLCFLEEARKLLPQTEIDFRLRPEGKNAPLVADLEYFEKYLNQRAGIWEFEALSKSRLLSGSENLFQKFKKIVATHATSYPKETIISSIIDMHKKVTASNTFLGRTRTNIKTSLGGIKTIEYIIHSVTLNDNDLYCRSFGKSNVKLLNMITTKYNVADFALLQKNYLLLKEIELTTQNLFDQNSSQLSNEDSKKELLNKILPKKCSNLQEILLENIRLFNSLVKLD